MLNDHVLDLLSINLQMPQLFGMVGRLAAIGRIIFFFYLKDQNIGGKAFIQNITGIVGTYLTSIYLPLLFILTHIIFI